MRLRTSPADLLLKLVRQTQVGDQEASFRQAVVALGQAGGSMGPLPLDGYDTASLEVATQVALDRGFFEDFSWIDPGSAAVALYELSSAIRTAPLRRELRRRVFSLLYQGNAGDFVPVATRIALGNSAPLTSPTLKARIALCLDLPPGSEVNVGPLALALATRSETHRAWIAEPSVGALPARRLAAQLLEQACREAIHRYQLGDTQPLDLMLRGEVRVSFERLLKDREPLVWRHAARARGVLGAVHADVRGAIEEALDPAQTITEWRRGVVSLVATSLLGDEEAKKSVRSVLRGPLSERDPGLAGAFVHALSLLHEYDPDHAAELLDELANTKRMDVAQAVAEFVGELRTPHPYRSQTKRFRETIAAAARKQTKGERAQLSRALRVLDHEGPIEGETDLPSRVRDALLGYETEGARAAYEAALDAIREAHELAGFVETHERGDEGSMGAAVAALLELDTGAFERPALKNLMLLGRRPGESDTSVEEVERLHARATRWILDGIAKESEAEWSRGGALMDLRRVRVLLHLVDGESSDAREGERPIVARLSRAIVILLERIADGPDATVHRVLCAALARSFDAAVREEAARTSDLFLALITNIPDSYSIQAIADASTTPDVTALISAWATFVQPNDEGLPLDVVDVSGSVHPDADRRPGDPSGQAIREARRVLALSQSLDGSGSYETESLRRTLFRLARSLGAVASARGLSELVEPRDSGSPVLDELTLAIEDLLVMMRVAERRVFGAERNRKSGGYEDLLLSEVVERAVASGEAAPADHLGRAIEGLVSRLPEALARAIEEITFRLHDLPLESPSERSATREAPRRAPLPDWLLPRRVIGSFHVVRPLGAGGVSSVFLARRYEERNNPKAEAFALKVPEYDPATARSLSEQEFFDLFREEAGALLSLPAHENLARFVTFDLSARPKPILVMELIRGAPLDRLIRTRALTMRRVIAMLDGILSGLEAMHSVGIGHLDLKPSNVILRDGKTPVLVDFGLSGRKLRPGCGTLEYTAPEVLGVAGEGHDPAPPPADVYAVACLAYELVTSELLFSASDELALVAQHVSHDGWTDQLQQLARIGPFENFAKVLGACLRADPRARPTVAHLRELLTRALLPLSDHGWPAWTVERAS